MKGWYFKRQRDPYTHAISLVVSKGFGRSVYLTLWWFTVGFHTRDKELDKVLANFLNQQERGDVDAS